MLTRTTKRTNNTSTSSKLIAATGSCVPRLQQLASGRLKRPLDTHESRAVLQTSSGALKSSFLQALKRLQMSSRCTTICYLTCMLSEGHQCQGSEYGIFGPTGKAAAAQQICRTADLLEGHQETASRSASTQYAGLQH